MTLDTSTAPVLCELDTQFQPCEFRIKWAATPWELGQARRLRRDVFCEEQQVFDGDDFDAIDAQPHQTLVALACMGGEADAVVGTVRIHEAQDDEQRGVWWGSRLAVAGDWRRHGRIGSTLIRLAVTSAHARGCQVFLAHVQAQNVPLFKRLHWQHLKDECLHGRPHALMQADLAHYPPCYDPYTGFVLAPLRATP